MGPEGSWFLCRPPQSDRVSLAEDQLDQQRNSEESKDLVFLDLQEDLVLEQPELVLTPQSEEECT